MPNNKFIYIFEIKKLLAIFFLLQDVWPFWAVGPGYTHKQLSVLWNTPPHTHCHKHSCAYLSICSHVHGKHIQANTLSSFIWCAMGAIIQINMLHTIIWISHCMFITHSTHTKRGGNTKEFTWGKIYVKTTLL